jgi:ABC-2 type transport system permease protein
VTAATATGAWLSGSVRSALRLAWPESAGGRVASLLSLGSALLLAVLEAWGTLALASAARRSLEQLPDLRPAFLLERLLAAGFSGAAFLLALGALTTAVSSLFLSGETEFRLTLPLPHRTVFFGALGRTVTVSSGPAWFLLLPPLLAAASLSPGPLAAAAGLVLSLLAITLLAAGAGALAALLLVRALPARRARILAAAVSALAIGATLVAFRAARPERLLDPTSGVAALEALDRFGSVPPPSPGLDPAAWAGRASALSLTGDPRGLLLAGLLSAGAALLLASAAAALAPLHLSSWRRTREEGGPGDPTLGAGIPSGRETVSTLGRELLRAEARTLARDAATPAQAGSLVAVLLLDLLNVRLLPAGDATSRDVVLALQAGLTLFLVSALSLRFAYPAVSADGRAAPLLGSLPLPRSRHLAARWAVRALPAAAVAVVLVGITAAALSSPLPAAAAALVATLAGALAIPALHLGLGALFPRYDAPDLLSVALGPGGLFALALGTALSATAPLAVSRELPQLAAAVAGLRVPPPGALLAAWLAAAAAATFPLFLAARKTSP